MGRDKLPLSRSLIPEDQIDFPIAERTIDVTPRECDSDVSSRGTVRYRTKRV